MLFSQRIDITNALSEIRFAKNDTARIKAELEASSAYLLVNTDSALFYAKKVLLFAEKEQNLSLKADALLAVGEAYSYTNQQIKAIENLLDARDIYEKVDNKEGLGHTLFALGELYNILKRYSISRTYFFKAIELYTSTKNDHARGGVYASLGDNYYSEKLFDSCFYFSNLAIEIGKKLNKTDILEYAYSNLADMLIEQKKFDEAKIYLAASNKISLEEGSNYGIAYGMLQQAKLYGGYKKYEAAFKQLDSCCAIAASLNMDDLIMDAEKVRYLLSKEAGMSELALRSLEKHDAIEDTLFGQKKYATINDVLERYRVEKKQKELEVLKGKAQLNYVLVVALSVVAFLLLLLFLSIFKRFKERKAMNLRLSEKNASIEKQAKNLQQINTVKDRMFSIISHDLRGPVSTLKSLIDFMKSESLSASESEMVVKELKQGVAGVDMLLENLLVWAQIQIRGGVSNKKEILNVANIVEEVIFISANAAALKNITLIKSIDSSLIVEADKNNLSLIIRNLVNNAVKFTPNGGVVTIEATQEEDIVRLCVIDTGIGLSQEEKEKLFNIEKPFTLLGTANEKGTGLGLMFVKEYTQSLGGTFTICSTKGKGSKFCVTL